MKTAAPLMSLIVKKTYSFFGFDTETLRPEKRVLAIDKVNMYIPQQAVAYFFWELVSGHRAEDVKLIFGWDAKQYYSKFNTMRHEIVSNYSMRKQIEQLRELILTEALKEEKYAKYLKETVRRKRRVTA